MLCTNVCGGACTKLGVKRVSASLLSLVQVSWVLGGEDESDRDSLWGLWILLPFG